LNVDDLKNVHYYFGKHRPDNKMITHLQIQVALGFGLASVVLIFHFLTRVFPGLVAPMSNFELVRALPYAFAVVALVYASKISKDRDASYKEFIANSPGVAVATTSIQYGVGHGFGDGAGG
jgi:hypothetical protein